jgi:hypothetical protein
MANNYSGRVPEYLDVDEFFQDAQRTVPVSRDVRREVLEEMERDILDPEAIRLGEDSCDLASRFVGAEGL